MKLDLLSESGGSTRRDFLKSVGALAVSTTLPVDLAPETIKTIKSLGGVLNCHVSGFMSTPDQCIDIDDSLKLLRKNWDILRHCAVSGVKFAHYDGDDIKGFDLRSQVDVSKLLNLALKSGYKINEIKDDRDKLNNKQSVHIVLINPDGCSFDITNNKINDDVDFWGVKPTKTQTSNPFKTWWDKIGSEINWSKIEKSQEVEKLFGDKIRKLEQSKLTYDRDISRWVDDGGQNSRLGESFISKLNNILR